MEIYICGNSKETNADVVLHDGHTVTIRGLSEYKLPGCTEVDRVKKFYGFLPRVDCHLKVVGELPPKKEEAPEKPQDKAPEGEVVNDSPEAPEKPEEPVEDKPFVPEVNWFEGLTKPQMVAKAQEWGFKADFDKLSKKEIVELVGAGK